MRRGRSEASRASPSGTPRLAALHLLGRRDYSAAEITTRLIDRGYDTNDVETAVATLVANGTIDDRRTAFAHVRTAARIKGRGAHRIRRELEARGLAAAVVAEAMTQLSPEDDVAAIERLLARRRRTSPMPPEERRRLFAQLMRRGFAANAIARALEVDPEVDREDET